MCLYDIRGSTELKHHRLEKLALFLRGLLKYLIVRRHRFFDYTGGIEHTGIGHHRDSVAREVGVPGTYDYGPQRTAWLATLVTNWMGDDAILKRLRGEMRRFNVVGDTTWITGTVSRTYIKDGYALVDIDIVGENQRGELTTKGMATVHLLSRTINYRVALTGADINLELPTVR